MIEGSDGEGIPPLATSLSILSLKPASESFALSTTSSSLSQSSVPTPMIPSSPSLYTTIRILKLVNKFKKKFAQRVHKDTAKKGRRGKLASVPCLDLEREAYAEIDKYLGRKSRLPKKKQAKRRSAISGDSHVYVALSIHILTCLPVLNNDGEHVLSTLR